MKSLARVAAMLCASAGVVSVALPFAAHAQSARALDARAARVLEYWTPERRAAAEPRDLVIDERGLGYLRARSGTLTPHGHGFAPLATAQASDVTGPAITNMTPAAGTTVGAAATFSATVADPSGVKSVSFSIKGSSGRAQSFTPTQGAGGVWSINLSGFTDGAWTWNVVAKDSAKPSNTTTSATVAFTVNTSSGGGGGGGGGGGSGTVPNAEWTGGGVVQSAAGRLYFEMPSNSRRTRWAGYVCSGTVANDATTGRSIIITASHCVYDDSYKAFARNVMFIPDQADTTGTATDLNCANDPIGCWVPSFGVVDVNWTTRTFPDNVHWDYAFYVVNDTGAHTSGTASAPSGLDTAVTPMDVSFAAPGIGSVTTALGYSYDMDPQFMYCADPMESMNADNYWLPNCGLTGGSSGGPWVQPFSASTGNGPIISMNSWGYTGQPGMAGPKLAGTSASCIFANAKSAPLGLSYADGDAGVAVTSCP